MKKKAIVLLSGGMDSLAVMATALKENDEIYALHITYGQNTAHKEKECYFDICKHYKIPDTHQLIIDLNFLRKIGGSSLTDSKIKVADYTGDTTAISTSYVPFRNTHIIASAVSWAETVGANLIYIGANEEDSPGYPDCRPAYYRAYNELIKQGTKEQNIQIRTPVIADKKTIIIQKCREMNAPLELTWSCYKNEDQPCMTCDSCTLRQKAFETLGLTDPII